MDYRIATEKEADAIAQFQVDMAMESEGLTLDLATLKKGVRAANEDPNKGVYLVALDGSVPVASLMLTKEWSDWGNCWYWWIQSVYVAPAYRRQGVYRSMYAKVKEMAKADGASQVRLYVDKENKCGQLTYEALGMKQSHYLMFEESL